MITGILVVITIIISLLWIRGIDKMHENHPHYKGEDFLNWDRKNDDWDNTKNKI
jgi:hypothetical protein